MPPVQSDRAALRSDRWEEWRQDETDQRKGRPPLPPQKPAPEGATRIDHPAPAELALGQLGMTDYRINTLPFFSLLRKDVKEGDCVASYPYECSLRRKHNPVFQQVLVRWRQTDGIYVLPHKKHGRDNFHLFTLGDKDFR